MSNLVDTPAPKSVDFINESHSSRSVEAEAANKMLEETMQAPSNRLDNNHNKQQEVKSQEPLSSDDAIKPGEGSGDGPIIVNPEADMQSPNPDALSGKHGDVVSNEDSLNELKKQDDIVDGELQIPPIFDNDGKGDLNDRQQSEMEGKPRESDQKLPGEKNPDGTNTDKNKQETGQEWGDKPVPKPIPKPVPPNTMQKPEGHENPGQLEKPQRPRKPGPRKPQRKPDGSTAGEGSRENQLESLDKEGNVQEQYKKPGAAGGYIGESLEKK